MIAAPKTPWGKAQEWRDNAVPGTSEVITEVWTAGHGGAHVPSRLLYRIPRSWQVYAKQWSGSSTWYEEDCAKVAVYLCFPEVFPEIVEKNRSSLWESAATFLPALRDDEVAFLTR